MSHVTGAKFQPFIVFSIYTNGKQLFSCEKPDKSAHKIHCIDGIRVMSTAGVVLIHTHAIYSSLPTREKGTFVKVEWWKLIFFVYLKKFKIQSNFFEFFF